jgi:hypothetical protein
VYIVSFQFRFTQEPERRTGDANTIVIAGIVPILLFLVGIGIGVKLYYDKVSLRVMHNIHSSFISF